MGIYLDHAASSPMSVEVLAKTTEALRIIGNPASTHSHGQGATELLEHAREHIAASLGAEPALVTLTGGGTESINLAVKGMYWAAVRQNPHKNVILVAEGEHHATLEAVEWLESTQRAEIRWLPIDHEAVLHPETLQSAIDEIGPDRIALITFLWANNEVGSLLPVIELTKIARAANVQVHIDAVAALGTVPLDFAGSGASAMSVSAHKIGGPVGVGALLLSRDARIDQLHHGGSQQRARAGTQNVAGAIGFAAALEEHYGADFEQQTLQLTQLRDYLIEHVLSQVSGAQLRGSANRLPGNAHFTFANCQGDSLVFLLDQHHISASMGSACQAGVAEVSHVLLAMGLPESEAIGSLRFSLSHRTTKNEIDDLLSILPSVVEKARKAGIS